MGLMLLAETMISGEWITGFVVAVITAVASGMVAYRKGQASGPTPPQPEVQARIPARDYSGLPCYHHAAMVDRVERLEKSADEIRADQARQFKEILMAGSEREGRLSDKLDGIARDIHHRMDEWIKIDRHN